MKLQALKQKASLHWTCIRRFVVIILLVIMAGTQIASIRGESQTIDEAIHIAAGVSYWQQRDFRMNEEHPPLIKLLAALPVLFLHPNVPYDDVSWTDTYQWDFGWRFLYQSGNDADAVLFAARMPMIALSALFGLLIYLWGKKIGGDWAGLIALLFFTFDPNFIAHGRYVTTDMGFAVGFTATLYCLVRLLEVWSWKRMVAFGLVFGLTQFTKFSAVFLWPIIILMPILWHMGAPWTAGRFRHAWNKTWKVFLFAFAGFLLLLPIIYFGQVERGRDDMLVKRLLLDRQVIVDRGVEKEKPIIQKLIHLTDPETKTGAAINRIGLDTPIPCWSYLKGLVKIIAHNEVGHLSYLMGNYSETGWVQYFPIVFVVKTPAVTFLLFTCALVFYIVWWRTTNAKKDMRPLYLLTSSSLIFFFIAMMGNISIGQRHIFAVYPPVFVLIGWFYVYAERRYRSWAVRASLFLIVILLLITSISQYPFYYAYASELIGGSKQGPRYLLDSNNDWGQGLKYLATYMKQEKPGRTCVSYYGIAHPPYYGLELEPVPTTNEISAGAPLDCLVIISATSLYGYRDTYSWLWKYQTDGIIAGTMYMFDFRNGRIPELR